MFKKPSDFHRQHLKNRFHDVEQRLDSTRVQMVNWVATFVFVSYIRYCLSYPVFFGKCLSPRTNQVRVSSICRSSRSHLVGKSPKSRSLREITFRAAPSCFPAYLVTKQPLRHASDVTSNISFSAGGSTTSFSGSSLFLTCVAPDQLVF